MKNNIVRDMFEENLINEIQEQNTVSFCVRDKSTNGKCSFSTQITSIDFYKNRLLVNGLGLDCDIPFDNSVGITEYKGEDYVYVFDSGNTNYIFRWSA